ncbi:MAG: hypothetical protein JNL83_14630 [Myxococcales bacterium]|nr:hypothetical protein [Myxococcales bacterium]
MLEHVSIRSWTLASLALGFLVALCLAIAPKPSCARVQHDASALVQSAREPSAREQAIEDELAIAEGTITGYIDADVARFEAARRATLLDDTGRYRERIERSGQIYR